MEAGDLESAIAEAKEKGVGDKEKGNVVSKDEEIGFHKGALNTLGAERAELVKMIGNVEAIAGAHIRRLKELGVEISS